MKKTIGICLMALVLVSVVVFYGCSKKEGAADKEGGMERMGEMMGGQGKEMEGQEKMGEHAGAKDESGAAMEKQHETMDALAGQWIKARSAALGGKAEDVIDPATKMHEAATHIKDFRLHKNSENEQEFLKRADEFNSLLMRFTTDAKQGNVESLRDVAPKIDEACNGCHQSFR
jgi:cytochrome c556